jgi:hypothetical protein
MESRHHGDNRKANTEEERRKDIAEGEKGNGKLDYQKGS